MRRGESGCNEGRGLIESAGRVGTKTGRRYGKKEYYRLESTRTPEGCQGERSQESSPTSLHMCSLWMRASFDVSKLITGRLFACEPLSWMKRGRITFIKSIYWR